MPYIIKPVNNGYKVCKRDEPNKCFSNKPLTKERAIKQEKAIILSELEGGSLYDIDEDLYMAVAKIKAEHTGYNPDLLEWADDDIHKLKYNGVKFGRKGYNDFIIYAIRANNGEITKEEALKHRKNYLARATKIKGKWKDNKESPNNLAINILW